jgi:mannose-6-phosphate isomerase-like protein (cupin superfamily)
VTTPGARAVLNLETGVHWERLTATSDPVVEFLTVLYPPGASSCEEDSLMRHGGKEYGYVTSGRLGVRVGFEEYELTAGMAISFDSSSPHRLWAIGDEPAEAIWVVVGRQNDVRGSRV